MDFSEPPTQGTDLAPLATRAELKEPLKTILVKLGSAALADPDVGGFSPARVAVMAQDCVRLVALGYRVLVVSSGAILAGRSIRFPKTQTDLALQKNKDMAALQAASALGQPVLMAAYRDALGKAGVSCAQVLVTHEDLVDQRRALNLKNMLLFLMGRGVIPILNENDSVSFEEITVGDNDQLAAMVGVLLEVDALVMMTSTDGLYSHDPSQDLKVKTATTVSFVPYGDPLLKVSLRGKSSVGRGGMSTKLEAVRKATPFGIPVILATSKAEQPILRALTTSCGTFFAPKTGGTETARQKKLTVLAKLNAEVAVDAGAAEALKKHKSLLPSGITGVKGQFRRGDSVRIVHQKQTIAVGLVEYSAQDLRRIKGHKSTAIEGVLGICTSKVAFHSDNLYLFSDGR